MLLQLLLFRAMPHGSIHSPSAINFFKSIGASERVINILEEGYKIPFRELPGTFWLSLVPKLHDHPLDLYEALKHYFEFTKMKHDQMLNTRLSSKGKAVSNVGISRSNCYGDNNKICRQLKLPRISEKMCKSIGTR